MTETLAAVGLKVSQVFFFFHVEVKTKHRIVPNFGLAVSQSQAMLLCDCAKFLSEII